MPISVQCSGCGQRLKANDGLAGRRLPCPKCRHEILIPERQIEDEAAALLLMDEPAAPATRPVPPIRHPDVAPASTPAPRQIVKPSPAPVASLPPLKSTEPPFWLRHLHWLLMLALVPLIVSLMHKKGDEDDLIRRLDESIDNAPPEVQAQIIRKLIAAEEGKADLDDVIVLLPRQRLIGAALSRNSLWHWAFAAVAAALFLGFCVLLATGGVADPRHLLGVGLFTGTIGILFLIIVQALAEWSQGVWPHGRSILIIFLYIAQVDRPLLSGGARS